MVFARIEQRSGHAWTQRAKLLVQMLTTTAYGSLGVGLADPVSRASTLRSATSWPWRWVLCAAILPCIWLLKESAMNGLNPAVPFVLAIIAAALGGYGLYIKYKIRQLDQRIAEREADERSDQPNPTAPPT